jgi:hypothetical protein
VDFHIDLLVNAAETVLLARFLLKELQDFRIKIFFSKNIKKNQKTDVAHHQC